jgi:TonB family protein
MHRYSKWEDRLRDRVNDELSYPIAAGRASGDVLVGFTIGADGRPAGISIRQSSGNPIFDAAALRVISRLGRMGPVPTAGGQVNEIVLKLSYGDGAATAAQAIQVAKADWQERRSNEARDRALVSQPTQVAERH